MKQSFKLKCRDELWPIFNLGFWLVLKFQCMLWKSLHWMKKMSSILLASHSVSTVSMYICRAKKWLITTCDIFKHKNYPLLHSSSWLAFFLAKRGETFGRASRCKREGVWEKAELLIAEQVKRGWPWCGEEQRAVRSRVSASGEEREGGIVHDPLTWYKHGSFDTGFLHALQKPSLLAI